MEVFVSIFVLPFTLIAMIGVLAHGVQYLVRHRQGFATNTTETYNAPKEAVEEERQGMSWELIDCETDERRVYPFEELQDKKAQGGYVPYLGERR